jgi:hypothetical protein
LRGWVMTMTPVDVRHDGELIEQRVLSINSN